MPTHLTRRVFRALLANEPIIHHGCLRRQTHSTLRHEAKLWTLRNPRNGARLSTCPQQRTFFSFDLFGRKRRDMKDADLDPGAEKMMELMKRKRMRARLPPRDEMLHAFATFITSKFQSNGRIEDTQAELLLYCLQYCTEHEVVEEPTGVLSVPPDVLIMAAKVLKKSVATGSPQHMKLVEELYKCSTSLEGELKRAHLAVLRVYVKYLAILGHQHQARDLVMRLTLPEEGRPEVASDKISQDITTDPDADESLGPMEERHTTPISNKLVYQLWYDVLTGFARGASESELLETVKIARPFIEGHPTCLPVSMLTFYLKHGTVEQLREWFSQYWNRTIEQTGLHKSSARYQGQHVHRLLQWCLQRDELEFGQEIVRKVMAASPAKPVWDAVLVWAAGIGKGVDEIDRMLQVMEDSNSTLAKAADARVADVETINALVEFAVSKDDPYMAERFIVLGRDRKIAPDSRTFVLQMEYRLRIKDVDGALVAYKNLQAVDLTSNEDVPTVNRLIVALCQSQRHDFDTIMNVTADLSDRQARFEPATVSNLSLLHLRRDEFDDVVDLLNTHTYHYSSMERESIRDDVLALCIDPKTPTSRSWDAFTLIREVFDETPRQQRTAMMLNFFQRERSDMAISVFNNMRTHSRADTTPTVDTYVTAFTAAAKLRDLESIEVIHNQLKLDYNINVNTYLNNALMLAFTACGKARKALDFWGDIVASKEGPTYNSIHIALRACEKSPFGDMTAQEIWSKLRKMKIELDQSLWASYVAALAGNGDNDLAFSAVEELEAKQEAEVDTFLIGSLFAGSPGQVKQQEIEEWAKARYPHLWEELLKIGFNEDEAHMRSFKIDRAVAP